MRFRVDSAKSPISHRGIRWSRQINGNSRRIRRGFEKKTFLVCDRCGFAVEVAESDCMFDVADGHAGWARAGADKVLCPECAPHYEVMIARHKVEIDDYLNNRI